MCDGASRGEVMQGEERVTRDWTGTDGHGQGEGQGGWGEGQIQRQDRERVFGWLGGWL